MRQALEVRSYAVGREGAWEGRKGAVQTDTGLEQSGEAARLRESIFREKRQ